MKNVFAILMGMMTLLGCTRDLNYSYLVQHPAELIKAMNRCQTADVPANQCEVVKSALMHISPYVVKMQEDPEKFGESLLTKETVSQQTEKALRVAESQVENMQKQPASQADLTKAINNRDNLRKTYADQQDEIQMMLGIVGLNSPE